MTRFVHIFLALYRLAQALIETFLASYPRAPQALVLDIDDTADEVHGAQQQALFNGHYDAYGHLPLHLYEDQSGKLITSTLRPGRRPTGVEIVSILKRVVGAIRREWPEVMILLRGDGHFSTPEVHEWCECQEPVIFYILGQGGNAILKRQASGLLEQARSLYRYHQARVHRQQVQAARRQQQSKSKTGGGKSRQHAQETTQRYSNRNYIQPSFIKLQVGQSLVLSSARSKYRMKARTYGLS